MSDPDEDDALIEELLDEALEGYEGLAPPEVVAAIRAQIGDVLAATPRGRQLLRQVRPDPSADRSGELARGPGVEDRAPSAGKKVAG